MPALRTALPACCRALVYRDSAAWFAFFHEEDQRDHCQYGHAEQAEVVEISEHGGLPLQGAFDQSVGLPGCECRTGTMGTHGMSSSL